MLLVEFKKRLEKLLDVTGLEFSFYEGDEGGQWYSIKSRIGLLEIYIASDCEVGINLPSEDDGISFGGCDEVYGNFSSALDRVRGIVS